MAEPVSWTAVLAAKYGPTGIGLVIGTAAKYGLTLSEGKPLSVRGIAGDLLLLGILGFIAIFIGDVAGRIFGLEVSNDIRVLTGSLAAVSSDRLVRLAREYFLRRTESELARTLQASSGTSAEIPAGVGEPTAVSITPPVADAAVARASSSIRSVYDHAARKLPPEDQIGLLRQLDTPRGE